MTSNKEKTREKIWLTKSSDVVDSATEVSEISKKLGLNPILARLLYNRGYTTPESAAAFLRMEKEMLRNPFEMADMERAVDRIITAIDRKEKVTVYGDYDVDGVTSVCTLYLYLASLGVEVDYYIPNRSGEGYGVSAAAIDTIKNNGTGLIITVDTGITANLEVDYAKTIGIDFLITDHHECRSELPSASAVVNPHRPDCPYPFKDLAGVGVVFKLICALEERISGKDRLTSTLRILGEFADLVAIGTIADVMPIKDENRIIVKYGLNLIDKETRVGIAALIDASSTRPDGKRYERSQRKRKNKITSGFIGYTLAPRINAAGRVRTATIAVELFLENNYSKAIKIAEQLCEANKERQAEENSIMKEAYTQIEGMDIHRNPVIVLDADNWHHGVIGIVASRITEKYSRPSILISFEGNEKSPETGDDIGKGSGRSIKGLNLVDALCYCSDDLVKFGGHELAAGLSVTRSSLPLFKEKINEFARANLKTEDMVPTIEADCEISFGDANMSLAESLQLLEPYGISNPVPLFIMRNVSVNEITGISENKHTKLTLGNGDSTLGAMFFSNSPKDLGVFVGDKIDILFSIDINEWQDRRSVQLIVRDLKIACSKAKQNERNRSRFEEIRSGATFTASEGVIPDRNDFVAVYTLVQNAQRQGRDTFSHKDLVSMLTTDTLNIGYVKLKFIIMVFREMNLLTVDEVEDEVYRFRIHYSASKKNLDKSSILKKLRSQLR